jgi:hypothetical protein
LLSFGWFGVQGDLFFCKWIAFSMLFPWSTKFYGNSNIKIGCTNYPFNRPFTDLGIELSQLFYSKMKEKKD